eukprot:6213735-Karenia_brevis.AAC.1
MSTYGIIDVHCHLHACKVAFQNFEAGITPIETVKQLSDQNYEHNYNIIVTHALSLKELPSLGSGCQKGLPSYGS